MRFHKRVYRLGTNTRQIVSNLLLLTDGTVLAGYRVGPRRWEYIPEAEKSNVIASTADVYGVLSGRPFHERVTTRPHPVAEWAANLDLRTPHPLEPVEGCDETWNRHLARQQARIAQAGMDDKLVFRYFGVGKINPKTDLKAVLRANALTGALPDRPDLREMIVSERMVADAVQAWPARRMTEFEQGWLRTRSMAPGVLPPVTADLTEGGWDEQALPALADHIRWTEEPFGRIVTVNAFVDGQRIERAVQVLSVSRMEDLNYPESGLEPWQTYAERATDGEGRPFGVDWSIVGELRTGDGRGHAGHQRPRRRAGGAVR